METQKVKKEAITSPLKDPPSSDDSALIAFQHKNTSALRNPTALLDAVASISKPVDVHRIAEEVARQIVLLTKADVCAISRWDKHEDAIILWAEFRRGELLPSPITHLIYKASSYPVTQQVLLTAQPRQLYIKDPSLEEGERIFMKGMGASALLMLPLIAHDHIIGLIELFEVDQDRVFSEEEVTNVQVLAEHAGTVLERTQLLADAKRSAAELEIIRQASLNLTASLDRQHVFNAILESVLRLSPDALDAHIFTYNDGKLTYGSSMWADGKIGPAWKTVRPGGLTDTVATTGKLMAVEDVLTHPLYKDTKWLADGWKGSIIGMPLKTGQQVVGVMNIAYKSRQEFTEDRLRLLGLLADQAAIAILNARLHSLVKQQAITDPLTEIANRRAFNERLEDEIRRSNRYQHTFTMMMMDLDGFKRVNDTFGHPTGDKTLKVVAGCLQRAVRDTDFLARIGGDEFALILPETSPAQGLAIDAKITESLSRCKMPWEDGDKPLSISLSIGIATYPQDAKDSEGLIAAADTGMYIKKGK